MTCSAEDRGPRRERLPAMGHQVIVRRTGTIELSVNEAVYKVRSSMRGVEGAEASTPAPLASWDASVRGTRLSINAHAEAPSNIRFNVSEVAGDGDLWHVQSLELIDAHGVVIAQCTLAGHAAGGASALMKDCAEGTIYRSLRRGRLALRLHPVRDEW